MSPNTPQPPAGVLDGFVPFPADRAAAYRAAGYWTGRPLDTILRDAAQQWPDRIAVLDAMGNTGITYADLDDQADRAASGLCGAGIAPGDRVLLQFPNGCQFAVALFGLLRAGAIPVMCLPGHRAAEIGHFAAVSEATGLLIADTAGGFDYRAMARGLSEEHAALKHVIVDGDPGPFTSWAQLRDQAAPPARRHRRPIRDRLRCFWFPAAPRGHPSSFPVPTTTTSSTRRPAPNSVDSSQMTSTWRCCRPAIISRWPARACSAR